MSASPPLLHQADSPTLKRAFSTPNSSFPSKKLEHSFTRCLNRTSSSPHAQRRPTSPGKSGPRLATPSSAHRPSMVQTSAPSFMPMPSFGSVFGGHLHQTGLQDHADVNGTSVAPPASSGNTNTGAPFSSFHTHSDSRDSNSTTSSDNSPTTTISTMDSSSVTDPSPGVSPESPLAKTAAPSSFVADFRSRRTEPVSGDSSPNTFFELQRPTTPAKKPRNLKNLGINTTSSLGNSRAQPTAPVGVVPKEKNNSAPPSPLFIKPPTPPKRRPSNLSLTISTPGSNESKPVRLLIPSTPSFNRPALRHFQSSPSLPLCSPSVNPLGGMQLPSLRPIVTKPSGLSEVPFEMEEDEDQEQNFDVPQSREEKPAAYPNGPICIYESGVFLYFEPTAEQAASFHTIINVASEVGNPFESSATGTQKDIDARRVDGPPAEDVDFATLSQPPKPASFGARDNSPTTPKAAPSIKITPRHEVVLDGKTYMAPEYIHVPWEHNTDIVSDLHKLVQWMDERIQQKKRILIHCQCGVSRSASLIVAYGLFKDPQMSVQEAYDTAKKRSKWIGPNMNLIMQLQEFRNSLLRQNESRSYHNQGYGRRSAGLATSRSTGASRYSPFDKDTASGSQTPRTAPLPPDCDISMQRASTGNIMAISPGPLSAPSGIYSAGFRRSWDSSQTHFGLASQPAPTSTPYVEPASHDLPAFSRSHNDIPSISTEDIAPDELEPPRHDVDSLAPSVPNFSRQLPLRLHDSYAENNAFGTSERHLAPAQPFGFGFGFDALRSPAVASFNIPSLNLQAHSSDAEIMSPIKTSFDNDLWPRGYDLDPHTTAPAHPAAPTEVTSPVTTHFPKDIFGGSDDTLDDELKSPRATEFHMHPLKPVVAADEDPFGLTSPTRGDFNNNPFEMPSLVALRHAEPEDRRLPFQAILPPSHQTFNGFASLDGTAQTPSMFHVVPPTSAHAEQAKGEPRDDHASISIPQIVPTAASSPWLDAPPKAPDTPQNRSDAFLSTPAKTIRTRFSSPNMREQRKLHKLQTEIQSKLPKPPAAQHAADDIDALMSPRAEEFTRNPFRFEIHPTGDDASPVSSNETIKEGRNGHDWSDPVPRQWTPEKATVDPRSPVQTGSSPIVRNIWDVL